MRTIEPVTISLKTVSFENGRLDYHLEELEQGFLLTTVREYCGDAKREVVELPKEKVLEMLTPLLHSQIPLMPIPIEYVGVLDGTTYVLTMKTSSLSVTYRWYYKPPKEYSLLNSIVDLLDKWGGRC